MEWIEEGKERRETAALAAGLFSIWAKAMCYYGGRLSCLSSTGRGGQKGFDPDMEPIYLSPALRFKKDRPPRSASPISSRGRRAGVVS